MKCPKCRVELHARQESCEGEYKGDRFVVNAHVHVCAGCGFRTMTARAMPEFQRALADAYRASRGRLGSTAIRARRRKLGLTQQEFAEYLGVGVASVKRWELGRIQDAGMDELIRIKTDPQHAARVAAEVRRRIDATTSRRTRTARPR